MIDKNNYTSTASKAGVLALVLMVVASGAVMAAAVTLQNLDTTSNFQNNASSITGTVNYTSPGMNVTEGGSYTSVSWSLSESPDSLAYDLNSVPAAATIKAVDGSGTTINSKTVSAAGTGTIDLSGSTATSVHVVVDVPDDADGTTGEVTAVEYVKLKAANDAPTADFVDSDNTSSVEVGTSITLDASASSDPDSGDSLTYTWDLNNDGTFGDATGSTATVSESSTGDYKYKVKVKDGNGATDTATFTLDVVSSSSGGSGGSGSLPIAYIVIGVIVLGGVYSIVKE